MRPFFPLAGLLALGAASCAPDTSSEPTATFDPALADGHSEEEHVQVSPGVYLLQSVVDAGTVRYVAGDAPESPEAYEALRAERTARSASVAADTYCYNYSSNSYNDQTRNESLFGGNPSWYGSADAYSYDYDGPGMEWDYERVSTYLYTSSPKPLDYISSFAYVYVNGDYAGYVSDTSVALTYTYAYGTWEAPCVDGSVSVEARLYHYWSNYLPLSQYMYIGNTLRATASCCPG